MNKEKLKIILEKLKIILEKHKLWLEGKSGGVKADLRGADLFRANLFMADLSEAKTDKGVYKMKKMKIIKITKEKLECLKNLGIPFYELEEKEPEIK